MALSPEQKSALLQGLGSVIGELDHAFLGVGDFANKVISSFLNAKDELLSLKHFDFNPKFKTRVISLPKAEQGLNDLWETIRFDLLGKYQEINAAVHDLVDAARSEKIGDANDLEGDHISALSKAVSGVEKLHSFLNQFGDLIVKAVELAGIVADIKNRIETLDDLFLSQSSTKKTVDVVYRKRQNV